MSTTWPCPVRARLMSASKMPCTAYCAARQSVMATPTFVGPVSGNPVTSISPDSPWITMS